MASWNLLRLTHVDDQHVFKPAISRMLVPWRPCGQNTDRASVSTRLNRGPTQGAHSGSMVSASALVTSGDVAKAKVDGDFIPRA